jgi:3-hydroxybutyryl-CoA dehydrogenase
MDTICICGAGTMGSGIAQVAAQSGYRTILYDVDEKGLGRAQDKITRDLGQLASKNRITHEERDTALSMIFYTSNLEEARADLVIEAIVENLEVKSTLINRLSELNSPETVFATNTSSLSVSRIAAATSHPEKLVGMHFFNPAPVMKLLEIVTTSSSSDKTVSVALEVAAKMKKVAVLCRDAPGFIVNHVARPFYLEALRLVEAGIADYETVDVLMEASGFRMGPFRLMDLIGNDVNSR